MTDEDRNEERAEERIPSFDELEAWMRDGGCEATDGCWVEPDGYCEHSKPSWLIVMGLI